MSAGIVAAVVAGVGAVASYKSSKKARKANERANEAQREINRLRNQQARRAFMRQFRQAQADVVSAGIMQGVGIESSMVQGQLSSQIAQGITATKEFAQMDDLGAEQTAALNQASKYQGRAALAGTVSSLASSFISFPSTGSGGGSPS